jgi:DNA replication protein DnaC
MKSASEFAKNPKGWLVITGAYATGKTHLAAAIANARADLGQPPLFIGVSDLLDHLRATFSPGSATSLDRRFEEIRTAPLLILDGLGEQSPTAWANEKLFQLIEYRYINKLPTVMTTAKLPEELDPRLHSRLMDARLCEIVSIRAPGYRGKAGQAAKKSSGKSKKT